jgi:hypothetical protein
VYSNICCGSYRPEAAAVPERKCKSKVHAPEVPGADAAASSQYETSCCIAAVPANEVYVVDPKTQQDCEHRCIQPPAETLELNDAGSELQREEFIDDSDQVSYFLALHGCMAFAGDACTGCCLLAHVVLVLKRLLLGVSFFFLFNMSTNTHTSCL